MILAERMFIVIGRSPSARAVADALADAEGDLAAAERKLRAQFEEKGEQSFKLHRRLEQEQEQEQGRRANTPAASERGGRGGGGRGGTTVLKRSPSNPLHLMVCAWVILLCVYLMSASSIVDAQL